MALTDKRTDNEVIITTFHPTLGSPGGARRTVPSPVRGRVLECGFVPDSNVTSAITMAVAFDDHVSSAASNFSQFITSTLGTFSSTVLFEGAVASVAPASPTFIPQGASIQFTTSGGQSSAVGGTVYAIIRKA